MTHIPSHSLVTRRKREAIAAQDKREQMEVVRRFFAMTNKDARRLGMRELLVRVDANGRVTSVHPHRSSTVKTPQGAAARDAAQAGQGSPPPSAALDAAAQQASAGAQAASAAAAQPAGASTAPPQGASAAPTEQHPGTAGADRTTPPPAKPTGGPTLQKIEPVGDKGIKLSWQPAQGAAKYGIYVNGSLLGETPDASFAFGLPSGAATTIEVDAIAADGRRTPKSEALQLPAAEELAAMAQAAAQQQQGAAQPPAQAQQPAAQPAAG